MIKKLVVAALIALPTMAMAQKFGVVNTQDIQQNLPAMKEAQAQMEQIAKKYEAEFQNQQTELQKKYEEYQKAQQANDPQTILDRRAAEIQEMSQRMEQFRQTAGQDLQRQQEQLLAPITQKVLSAIQAVGAEGGFTIIFENQVPVYTGSDVQDVTAQVKTKLEIK